MRFSLISFVVGLSFFPCKASVAESPLTTVFLPAILAAAANSNGPISCRDLTGCYYGVNSDNSLGYTTSGKVKVRVNEDCSFSGVSQNIVKFSGEMRQREGNVLSGAGTAVGDGTSYFSLTCSVQSGTMSCNYSNSDGLTGHISNAKQGVCKVDNRFLTETLAGHWQFNYSIGSSPFVNYYDLYLGTVKEIAGFPGSFSLDGVGEYNDYVIAGYDQLLGFYSLYDPGSLIDEQFIFNYSNLNRVEGCFYLYPDIYGTWSDCYPMTGSRY